MAQERWTKRLGGLVEVEGLEKWGEALIRISLVLVQNYKENNSIKKIRVLIPDLVM